MTLTPEQRAAWEAARAGSYIGQGTGVVENPALYGSTGANIENADRSHSQYYEGYTQPGDDSGTLQYRLKPEYEQALGNNVQLGAQSGSGGYGEAIDPDQISFDPRFGYVTSRANVKDPEKPRERMMNQIAMAVAAGGLGAGVLADMGAFGAASGVSPPDAYWNMMADSGQIASDVIPSSGGNFLSQAGDYLSNSLTDAGSWAQRVAGQAGDYLSNLGSSAPEQLSGPGMSAGGNAVSNGLASSLNLDGLGLSNSDVARLLASAGGGILNYAQGQQQMGMTEEQAAQSRQLQREMAFRNTNTPYGTSNWAQDPTTHQWTQTQTLNPADQARLEQQRRIASSRMASAAGIKLPENVNFQEIYSRFLPPSMGGTYVGGR